MQELEVHDKPVLTIFNKLDKYAEINFDEWLEPEVKEQLLKDLEGRWQNETHYNCIFVSATEKINIEELRKKILDKVREHYAIRYPFKSNFY
jgi:GTP-binding protein HflX